MTAPDTLAELLTPVLRLGLTICLRHYAGRWHATIADMYVTEAGESPTDALRAAIAQLPKEPAHA